MPKSRVYGTPIDEKPSTATDRNVAKPPSEAYIRAQMNRERRTAADKPKTDKPAKPASQPDEATKDLSVTTAVKRLKYMRGPQIDKAVEDAG